MTRREALLLTGGLLAHTVMAARQTPALPRVTDQHYLRLYHDAQKARPAVLSSAARIAPSEEPGEPLQVVGTLIDTDGRTPARNAVIFAYHTDVTGEYDRPGGGWRLKGWARPDASGRFVFDTIGPAPYPDRSTPAHVHVCVELGDGSRRTLKDVLFEGDPLLNASDIRASKALGRFAYICPVRRRDGRATVDIALRLPGDYIF